MTAPSATIVPSRWLHGWALLTVAATVPLLFLGAAVTTYGFGLVDPRGLRTPWYFFRVFMEEQGLAWIVEHGHRQVGWIVGLCSIILTVLLWLKEPRRWVCWLGTAGLVCVCIQGVLGIFRIELHAVLGPWLAYIHGCFAQVVFTLLVCIALLTSRSWLAGPTGPAGPQVRSWAVWTAVLVFAQLLVGGLVRHMDFFLAGRVHLLLAFAVVAAGLWLAKLAHEAAPRAVKLLLVLLAVQVFLGIEAWLGRFFNPTTPYSMVQPLAVHAEWFRSLHYVVGALIFATTVVVALRVAQACVLHSSFTCAITSTDATSWRWALPSSGGRTDEIGNTSITEMKTTEPLRRVLEGRA